MTLDLYIDGFPRATGDAHLATVLEEFVTDAGRLTGFRILMGNVGDVDGAFLLHDAAGIAGRGAGMALHHMDALHDDAALRAQHAQNLALLALVPAGDDDHLVALLDFQLRRHVDCLVVPRALPAPGR